MEINNLNTGKVFQSYLQGNCIVAGILYDEFDHAYNRITIECKYERLIFLWVVDKNRDKFGRRLDKESYMGDIYATKTLTS